MSDPTKSQLAEVMKRATQLPVERHFPEPYKMVTDNLSRAASNRIATVNARIELMKSLSFKAFD